MKKASETINITQPSLTKSIKTLEQALDKELFTRLPKGVKLTSEGEILYRFCHDFFNQIDNIETKLADPLEPFKGTLRVGTYDSIAVYFWPHFLQNFLKKYPKLKLELTTGRSSDIQEKLENAQLDFILIINAKTHPLIEIEPYKKDLFKLYRAHEHLDNLIYMPTGNLESSIKRKSSLTNNNLYKTSSLESVKELTVKGIGIGVLPTQVARPLVEQNQLTEIELDGIEEHRIEIAYLKSKKNSPLIQALLKELTDY